MTADTMEQILEKITSEAIVNLRNDNGLNPVAIILKEGNLLGIAALEFRDPQSKAASLSLLGALAEKEAADVVVIVSDAHMSTRPVEAPDGPPPSEDPARTEAIIVSAKWRAGRTVCVIIPYTRTVDGMVDVIGERKQFPSGIGHVGMMDAIFPHTGTTH